MIKEVIEQLVNQQSTKNISYVIEHEDEVIQHQENKIYRSASVIKIPLCLAALKKEHEAGRNDLILVPFMIDGFSVLYSLNELLVLSVKVIVVLSIIELDSTASSMMMDFAGFPQLTESL